MSGLIRVPPLAMFRRMADADLKGRATAAELTELYGNPALWLRALILTRADIQHHIAKDLKGTKENAPAPGASKEEHAAYFELRKEYEARHVRRLHVVRILERRIGEVKSLLGPESVANERMVGDMVEFAIEIAEMAAAGDLEGVRGKANGAAELWSKAYERRA